MANKVTDLPATTTMTCEQALQSALKDVDVMAEVLVIAVEKTGEVYVRSSRMTRRDAYWLAMLAQEHARHG